MSSFKNIVDIYKVVRNDEDLLRLLIYPPEDMGRGIKDPLDKNLQNIKDKSVEELFSLQEYHILSTGKSSDMEEKEICRIYIYNGRRNGISDKWNLADQELIIDVFVHHSYENGDFRSARINDRLNDVLISSNFTGVTKMRFDNSAPIGAPKNYIAYRTVYEYTVSK